MIFPYIEPKIQKMTLKRIMIKNTEMTRKHVYIDEMFRAVSIITYNHHKTII